MSSELFLKDLEAAGAVITGSHIVYASGKHGSAYVNKDVLYQNARKTSAFCRAIARSFLDENVEVVVAPAMGGIVLTQWVSIHLTEMTGCPIDAVYAEQDEEVILKAEKPLPFGMLCSESKDRMKTDVQTGFDGVAVRTLAKEQKLVIKKPEFVFRRGYDKLITGKRVLVVEDVLNTGGSVSKVITAVLALGGNVVGVGALCNRGGVTAEQLGVPKLVSLVDVSLEAWEAKDCPLCKQGVPINTQVGKGREFLAQQGK